MDTSKNRIKARNVLSQDCSKCPPRMHLVGRLLTNHILACIDAPESSFFNGENRPSLSCSYQKLFEKKPPAFFSEMGNSEIDCHKTLLSI
jgi:hypothetical protein